MYGENAKVKTSAFHHFPSLPNWLKHLTQTCLTLAMLSDKRVCGYRNFPFPAPAL